MKLPLALARHTFGPTLQLLRGVLERADPQLLRTWAARVDGALAADVPGVSLREVRLPNCSARWLDARGALKNRVVLYLHGGAFITETPQLHGGFLARLCLATRCHGFMPSYRLAPEHPFPAAPDDCLDAYRWLLDQGYQGSDIVLAGDSAGGNLCLGLLLRLRDAGLPLPACAVTLSPLTDATFGGASIARNDGLDPMFTARSLHRLAPAYLPNQAARSHPLASPLSAELDGLPPVLLLAGSSELLLDDSVRFALKCPDAQLQVWHDMPHTFPLYQFLPEAGDALHGIARFVNEHLAAARRRANASVAPPPEDAAAIDTEAEDELLPAPVPGRGRPRAAHGWVRLLLAFVAGAAAAAAWLHWAG